MLQARGSGYSAALLVTLSCLPFPIVAKLTQKTGHKQLLKAFGQSFSTEFAPDLTEITCLGEEVNAEIHLAKALADYEEQRLQAMERAAATESRAKLGAFLPNAVRDLTSLKDSQALQCSQKSGG